MGAIRADLADMAKLAERQRIVAWLREPGLCEETPTANAETVKKLRAGINAVADAIERGEHWEPIR